MARRRSRRTTQQASLDFAFFTALHQFYQDNKGTIRRHYRDLTKRFLDYNDLEHNANAFLRKPQFEALEMYVFLKEYLDNAPVHQIFQDWRTKENRFQNRQVFAQAIQQTFFEMETEEQYAAAFDLLAQQLEAGNRPYANYIFALTMGTGKTILMATCIFYEFLLANKFPKDPKYCHNAIVFAPDTTVLEALREIQTFDMGLVVPPEYVAWLSTHIQFHFLDEAGIALSTLDRSDFNLIISNTQKIILKRRHQEQSPADQLFRSGAPTYESGTVYDEFSDLYNIVDEVELTTNQRFEKLRRLAQLGIYVDEAHHAFGKNLARDVGAIEDTRTTSLRLTIDELARSLESTGTHVVACYNYTGTPYAEDHILPEVVYAYGLQEAIDAAYLKLVKLHGYDNVRNEEFVSHAITDFLKSVGDTRHENCLPKMAFFATTIAELQNELRPAVETVLGRHGIAADRILVNVGDPRLTSDDDIREFNRLDTSASNKQFILLVGKGREGWNCRSLFSVALFRKPKSKIFVLQATMRCLRSIGEGQQTGHVYLSKENVDILENELQQNFRVTVEQITSIGQNHHSYRVHVAKPPVSVKLKRVHRMYRMTEKSITPGVSLDLASADTEKYRLTQQTIIGLPTGQQGTITDISDIREQRQFSRLTLVAEVARYLNKPCLEIEDILGSTAEGVDAILTAINQHNELLYDWVIPRLFGHLYRIEEYTRSEEYEVELVKEPEAGYYTVTAHPDKVVEQVDAPVQHAAKSFHLDTYAFDSNPEKDLFWRFLRDGSIRRVYFTGMLTHGQSEFYIQYIDPETSALRSYYPDFLLEKDDGNWVIVEVKGDNKIDDPIVLAKADFATQLAAASGMTYGILKGSECAAADYTFLLDGKPRPAASLFTSVSNRPS